MKKKYYKDSALRQLKGNYSVIVICLLIYIGINCLLIGISKLLNLKIELLFLIVNASLLYEGLIHIAVKISKNNKQTVSDLFSQTHLTLKSFIITLFLTFITAVFVLFETLTYKALTIFSIYESDLYYIFTSFMTLVGFIILIVLFIFYVIIMIYYSQSYYVLYENNEMKVKKILEQSFDIMDNNKLDYLFLNLSFIPWILLGIPTFGIIYIWLIPYIMLANYNFYNDVKPL